MLTRLAHHRMAPLLVAGMTLAISVFFTLCFRLPQPRVHDEFSYLLQADTFLHGRFSNPAHPLWKHFETFHVLQKPVYASKYPPAQGAFLAFGSVLGHPIIGVWLGTALAMAALFWMLAALLPRKWAMLACLLTLLNPQVLIWNWSYWGGSIPLLGGALVTGGVFRTLQKPCPLAGCLTGLGMALLMLSRPFEGVVFCALMMGTLLVSWWRKNLVWKPLLQNSVIPIFLVNAAALGFLLNYNFRITGNALKMPYAIYEETYSRTPLFLWLKRDRPMPVYNNLAFSDFYAEQDEYFDQQQTWKGFGRIAWEKVKSCQDLAWYWLLPFFLLGLRQAWRRNTFVALSFFLLLVFTLVEFLLPTYLLPHYLALVFPLVVLVVASSLREMRTWKFSAKREGRFTMNMLLGLACVVFVGLFALHCWQDQHQNWEYKRADLLARLQQESSKQLVIVRYSTSHNHHDEWVANEADIDHAHVVWARDIGEKANEELVEYFKDRKVTVIEPDKPEWGK